MTTTLNSRNAINGQVFILVDAKDSKGRQSSYVLTYGDNDGDYGDAFAAPERETLAKGLKVTKADGFGGQTVARCMVTGTRGA